MYEIINFINEFLLAGTVVNNILKCYEKIFSKEKNLNFLKK